jgi:hypothetical protein
MDSKKAVPSGDLIEALVIMRQAQGFSSSIRTLLHDAERYTGLKADSVTELVNLNAFNMRGARRLVDAIAHASAVQEVIPTGGEASAMIKPVAKRRVNLVDVPGLTGKSRSRKTAAGDDGG